MDDLYSGAASFGILYSKIVAYIVTFIGGIAILYGLYLVFKPSIKVSGSVMEDSVLSTDKNNIKIYTTSIEWDVSGSKYHNAFTTFTAYTKGQEVDIYYSGDPKYGSLYSDSTLSKMYIFIPIGVIGLAWLWLYILQNNKFLAAASGASDAYKLLR